MMAAPPTPRQLEALRLAWSRQSTKEAAHELRITQTAVKALLCRAYERLEVHTLAEAVEAVGKIEYPDPSWKVRT